MSCMVNLTSFAVTVWCGGREKFAKFSAYKNHHNSNTWHQARQGSGISRKIKKLRKTGLATIISIHCWSCCLQSDQCSYIHKDFGVGRESWQKTRELLKRVKKRNIKITFQGSVWGTCKQMDWWCWEISKWRKVIKATKGTLKLKVTVPSLTCSLNFHCVPTSTPGIGPKWFWGTMVHTLWRPAHAKPLPQSREVLPLAEAILAFFLLSFSFSPAFTISVSSFLHSGQNLQSIIILLCCFMWTHNLGLDNI